MNKNFILLKYTKGELESKKKERAERERLFRESITTLDVIIADLENKASLLQGEQLNSDDSEGYTRRLIIKALQQHHDPERGITIAELETSLTEDGVNFSYKKIERCVKSLVKNKKAVQTNPDAQRYRRFRMKELESETPQVDALGWETIN